MVGRVFGFILVLAGLVFLGIETRVISVGMDRLWPAFVLIPGILFEAGYFTSSSRSRYAGLLVPGGIITTIGLLFLFETATGWRYAEYTWPVYIAAPAIGLFQFYLAMQPREKALLIPVCILGGVAAIASAIILFGSILSLMMSGPIFGILLIAAGAFIIIKRK